MKMSDDQLFLWHLYILAGAAIIVIFVMCDIETALIALLTAVLSWAAGYNHPIIMRRKR